MKKNIFLILGLLMSHSVLQTTVATDDEQTTLMVEDQKRCDERADEFEDFFGAEEEENEAPRKQKPKLSRMQLAMIRLGVGIALGVENFYNRMRFLCRYLKSWVVCENRKA